MSKARLYSQYELNKWANSPERERLQRAQKSFVWPYVLDYLQQPKEIQVKMGAFPNNHPEWKKLMDIRKEYPQEWFEAEMIRSSAQWSSWMEKESELSEWQKSMEESKSNNAANNIVQNLTPDLSIQKFGCWMIVVAVSTTIWGLMGFSTNVWKLSFFLGGLFASLWPVVSYRYGDTFINKLTEGVLFIVPCYIIGLVLYFLGFVFWFCGGFLMDLDPIIGLFGGVCGVVVFGGLIAILFGWNPKD